AVSLLGPIRPVGRHRLPGGCAPALATVKNRSGPPGLTAQAHDSGGGRLMTGCSGGRTKSIAPRSEKAEGVRSPLPGRPSLHRRHRQGEPGTVNRDPVLTLQDVECEELCDLSWHPNEYG